MKPIIIKSLTKCWDKTLAEEITKLKCLLLNNHINWKIAEKIKYTYHEHLNDPNIINIRNELQIYIDYLNVKDKIRFYK